MLCQNIWQYKTEAVICIYIVYYCIIIYLLLKEYCLTKTHYYILTVKAQIDLYIYAIQQSHHENMPI